MAVNADEGGGDRCGQGEGDGVDGQEAALVAPRARLGRRRRGETVGRSPSTRQLRWARAATWRGRDNRGGRGPRRIARRKQ